jgi:hypothetical protein
MADSILLSLLIAVIIVFVVAAVIKYGGAELGASPGLIRILLLVLGAIFLIYLIKLLFPLLAGAA